MPSCPGGPWRPWRSWISPDRRGGSPPPFKAFPLGGRCPSAHTGADEGAMIAWFRLSQGSFAAPAASAAFFTLRIAGGRVLVRFCNISGAQNLSGFPQFNPGPLGPRVCKNYRCCDLSSAPEFAEPTVPGSRYLIRPPSGAPSPKGEGRKIRFYAFPFRGRSERSEADEVCMGDPRGHPVFPVRILAGVCYAPLRESGNVSAPAVLLSRT